LAAPRPLNGKAFASHDVMKGNHEEAGAMTVDLSSSEGLVLFELLARFEKSGVLEIEHPAEERVLEQVQATLERTLVEPFRPDYQDLLSKARTDVCARWGG
jgi:hypothetical protein